MVELVRAGRDPAELAREFEPSAQAIRNWVAAAERQEGRRAAKPAPAETALNAAEREELARLRRENKQLRQERDDILGELERRGAVVIQVLPHRTGEGRRVDALDVEEEVVRVHGVEAVGRQAVRREVGDV
jgi:transposase